MNKKLNILHITYDLRDRLNKDKTTAVKNLIDISKTSGNAVVIDLVRVPLFSEEKIEWASENHLQINSFGLPYGIFLKKSLDRVLDNIANSIRSGKINLSDINIVHAHKLTFEGYIGYKIASKYSIPLVITLRQTDSKVLRMKPNLLPFYKKVLQYSKVIFYLNPYSIVDLESQIGTSFFNEHIKYKLVLLPNIIKLNSDVDRTIQFDSYELLTIIRMTKESVHRKNLKRLLKAFSLIKNDNLKLKIIGDGEYLGTVKKWIKKYKLQDRVTLLGNIQNSEIHNYYLRSAAFVLPSLSESFGMVYAESLICNTPILYSKNRLGFDGFFEGVGPAIDALSVKSIKEGILNIIRDNDLYRQKIKILKDQNAFDIFSKPYIKQQYFKQLSEII